MTRRIVLIAAGDAVVRATVARVARAVGCAVELAESARRAREITASCRVDLAIIDVERLGPDSPRLIGELRDTVGRVVLVGERGAGAARYRAPLVAADATLVDVADERALAAQIAQTMAPPVNADHEAALSDLLGFEGRLLDVDGRVVRFADGQETPLTHAEFRALSTFLRAPGRVLSRGQLRIAVAGEEHEADERSIDMLVSRLRRKIEPDPARPRVIVTVPGAGYRCAARVQRVAASSFSQTVAMPPASSERRPLTILSCSIEGLAAIADTSDTEEMPKTMGALRRICDEVVGRYGGIISAFLGDSLVVHFGYPEAHEDDAERAVRTGLDLAAAVAQPHSNGVLRGLRTRIGIATGTVVLGDLAVGGDHSYSAIGEAASLAKRLAAAAPLGAVVVSERTRMVAGRGFTYRPADPIRSAGSDAILPAWRVTGEVRIAVRFAARRVPLLGRLIGRAEEIAMLRRRWRQASRGAGQVVLLTGEPGIGKSRLALEAERSIARGNHFRVAIFGSPRHTASPLFPVLRHIERAAGFSTGDDGVAKLAKLAHLIGGIGSAPSEAVALLAGLLSVPHADEAALRNLSPQRRKEKSFDLLLAMIDRLAARQPIFLLVEDAQWIDPTTLELLSLAVDRVARAPILLLITARSDFTLPWPDHAHVGRLALSRLGPDEAAELVGRKAVSAPLTAATVEHIVARGDGVPLFLEELTKMALDLSASTLPGDRAAPVEPIELNDVPPTLESLLLARIDRVGAAAKSVAQVSAAIGRSFSYELLRLIESGDATRLDNALERLAAAGLVFRRGVLPAATYSFKHALVRDAAYASLSQHRRRQLHAGIAEVLESRFPDTAEAQPELLAHHHAAAGNEMRAIDCLIAAGEQALLRAAGREAWAQIEECLGILARMPEDEDRCRRELAAQILRHRAAITTGGRTSPEARRALQRACELCIALDDQVQLPWILFGQWYSTWSAAGFAEAAVHARALLRWGERHESRAARTLAEYALGSCLLNRGSLREARSHFDAAHALDQFDELPGALVAGYWAEGSVRAASLLHRQICLTLLGCIDEAEKTGCQAQAVMDAMSHDYARAIGLLLICRNHALRRDAPRLLSASSTLVDLAGERGYPDFTGHAMVYNGWAAAMMGKLGDGLGLARAGLDRCLAVGYRIWHSHMLALLAECQWLAGDAETALHTLAEAQQVVVDIGERLIEAELHRLKGMICHDATGDLDAAERSFTKGLEITRGQGARLLELRVATSLARLWQSDGRRREARDLLAPIVVWFADDCITDDLVHAAAVLRELD